MTNEPTFEIKVHVAVLSEQSNGWKKELNIVEWNGNGPKYDIRSWNEDHSKMSRGVTLTTEEFNAIVGAVKDDEWLMASDDDDDEPDDDDNEGDSIRGSEDYTIMSKDGNVIAKIHHEDITEAGSPIVTILNETPQGRGTMKIDVIKFVENHPLKDIGDLVRKVVKPAVNSRAVADHIMRVMRMFVLDNAHQSTKAAKDNYKRGSRLIELVSPLA